MKQLIFLAKFLCDRVESVERFATQPCHFPSEVIPPGGYAELQKVVDLPPNLKFMLSTFLILTRYIITGKQLNGVLRTRQKNVIGDLPMSFVCLGASKVLIQGYPGYQSQKVIKRGSATQGNTREATVLRKLFIN